MHHFHQSRSSGTVRSASRNPSALPKVMTPAKDMNHPCSAHTRHARITGEAMEDDSLRRTLIEEYRDDIVVGIPVVDHQSFVDLARSMCPEGLVLGA